MKFVVNNFESIPNFINAIMHLQTMQDSPDFFMLYIGIHVVLYMYIWQLQDFTQ